LKNQKSAIFFFFFFSSSFVFCKVERGNPSLIKSVAFHLHESFNPSVLVKTVPPFETTQSAYGFFVAEVEVNFYRAPSQKFEHEINFAGGAYSEVVVSGGALPTLEDVEVPKEMT
jgi:transcription initiation factor IIF auxiliary subunit